MPVRVATLALLSALLVSGAQASAGPLAPSKPSQLVVARAASTPCPVDGFPTSNPFEITWMSTPDGTPVPFAIPAKQMLVVTSVSLVTTGGVANATAQLLLIAVASPTELSVLAEGYARTDANGLATYQQSFPTGVAVRSGVTLCIAGTTGSTLGSVTGFFAKDK